MMVIGRDLNSGMLGLSPGSQSPIRTEFRIGQEGLAFRVRCPGIRQSPSGRNCPVLAVHAHDAGQRCVVETIIAEPGFSSSPGIIARNSQTAVELYAQIENHLVENRGQRRYVRLARASHTQGCATLAMISWAHANTDWDQNLTARWERAIREFAHPPRSHGIDADLDLWHFSGNLDDWTRWGPDKIRTSEFPIGVLSEAWKQRWQGTNTPTVGAGAGAEADL
jgi:hypothetical protein